MTEQLHTESVPLSDLDGAALAAIEEDVIADMEQLTGLHRDESAQSPPTRARGPASAGDDPAKPASIYDRLQEYGLLRKVTDIVMAKIAIPWHLRKDAEQEVHTAWLALKAKNVQRDQMAYYAYLSGQHAALKLRRTIGAVVTIPGALFRTGRNTAFMEAIGAAVNPKDVDDYRDSLELSVEPVDVLHMSRVSESFFEQRLGALPLSAKQRNVAFKALVERKSAEDIAVELEMDLMYVERLLNQVTSKLNEKDASPDGEIAVRQPRKTPRVVVGHPSAPAAARVLSPRKKKEGSVAARGRRKSRLKLSKAPSGGKAASMRARLTMGKRASKALLSATQLSFGFEEAAAHAVAFGTGSKS
ncbi:hypothetical protein G3A43_07235 [Paraburkholderia aspalathi]|nr:hypothetical protein [Paraburkholderia aspalathi]MBK3780046.1 hypothetical protein [Paraburkholderia aspalathi]